MGMGDEPMVDQATVRDFIAVMREASQLAAKAEQACERIVARAAALGTTVDKLAALGVPAAVEARTRLKIAAGYRSIARAACMAAARWKHRPHVRATETWDAAGIEAAAAPVVAVMLSWLQLAAELVERITERLPLAHGPPVRQLTEVHAPCCGVPAPPPLRRTPGVDP